MTPLINLVKKKFTSLSRCERSLCTLLTFCIAKIVHTCITTLEKDVQ